jgi:hypothetical protein
MVQVDISQITGECNTWRESLRQCRDEFSKDKVLLQHAVSNSLSKDQLQEVEHLHNQFHIQLINIHDLKQSVKIHERTLSFETDSSEGLSEQTISNHENLFDQYQTLTQTLQDLRDEFSQFLNRT